MKERPILFSTPMVRAVRAGTKTQTRRVCKAVKCHDDGEDYRDADGWPLYDASKDGCGDVRVTSPYGRPGASGAVAPERVPRRSHLAFLDTGNTTMTITAYPLAWPPGWKRTAPEHRTYGRFGVTRRGEYGPRLTDITVAQATQRIREELNRMGVRDDDLVLSTNLKLRLDGLPRSDQAKPADPGAAIYWNDPWGGPPRCMAIDRYTQVEQNIAALAATIEAMRAIERHGGAVVLERAFTGFTALPAPAGGRPWWEVLECPRDATADTIRAQYRRLAAGAHPDRGGSDARMAELNRARDEALQAYREVA